MTGTKTRMFYTNFDENITDKHGIIVKNWPLPVFCAPGDIRTVTELRVLYNALESGTAHFYRMTMDKATKWVKERSSSAIATSSLPLISNTIPSAMGMTAPSANQDLPSESGSGDSDVTAGNGSANTPIDNPDATTANANPTDPDVSEQTNPSIASTPIPSLPTPNSTPPTDSATASSGKRARAAEGQPLPPTKRRRQGLAPGFINTSVTSVDGATVLINKKPRKERSDKGRKRAK